MSTAKLLPEVFKEHLNLGQGMALGFFAGVCVASGFLVGTIQRLYDDRKILVEVICDECRGVTNMDLTYEFLERLFETNRPRGETYAKYSLLANTKHGDACNRLIGILSDYATELTKAQM